MATKKIIIYGVHTVRHCLEISPTSVLELWVSKEKLQNKEINTIINLAKTHKITIQQVTADTLDNKTQTQQHQGIALSRQAYPLLNEQDLSESIEQNTQRPFLFLVLDSVQDPHNLGACFRSADAANVDGIIVAKDRSVQLTPVVCKVASGAVETVPFYTVTNIARTLRQLKDANIWVYGLDGDADQTVYQTRLTDSVALVMGAEGEGLRQNTRKQCDQLVKIPMLGKLESLNVSVATGVILCEALRQRHFS